jgi:CBS domain-containing protein
VVSVFPFETAPFDCLLAAERVQLQAAVRSVEFARDTVILSPETEAEPAQAYLLVSGHVQLAEAGEAVAVYAPHELFAVRAVLTGRCSGNLVAMDAVVAWQIPKAVLLDCIRRNAAFSAALFARLGGQLQALDGKRRDREFLALMMAPIGEAYLRKPHYVDGGMDIVSVCRVLCAHGLTNTLVRDLQAGQERIGMFTTTDLRDALLQPLAPDQLPVARVARFDLISIGTDAALFDALLMMIHHRVHRILVKDGERIVGVLSQLDLMGFVSNHSHLIALQVGQSESIDELRRAALQMDGLIEVLHSGGARIEVIAGLVSELNSQVFARLWTLLAPPELVANSCLLVMGSEGRGEQILKTDQDNALLLRDGFEHPELAAVAAHFNAALRSFGYPECPGNIMVSNPAWRQHASAFRETLRQWLYGELPEAPMHLAIFLDARSVAGDATLLQQARAHLHAISNGSDALLARFASAIDQFSEPGGWWSRVTALRDREDASVDIKKLGTFPIVHGMRALALQYRLEELGTVQRIRVLSDRGHLDRDLARDLTDTLHFLMGLKLRNNLYQRQLRQPCDNLVQLSRLGTMERDTLKDALAIIRRLRQFLRLRYRLDAL